MLIASYNPTHVGDTLIVLTAPDAVNQAHEAKTNITRIFDTATGTTTGYNFLKISELLDLAGVNGSVELSDEQVAKLNAALVAAGFEGELVADHDPKFVVAYVESTEPHADSDHLQVTKTQIGEGDYLQIVSGSPNMKAGIKVVVAKVGAMMPSGLIIWPGALRGVESNGMIVSGRELRLPNAPQVPGAMILPDDFQAVGAAFDFEKAQGLFA
ncbi:DUF4479 domain-containing protein [Periweissella cryptocerci]|uniref:DUF4479 domain-containing protein n=1 Tax=Periweissella cryptocerci TaxID=2506420 RepID=A0A4P6YS10_9LACO|nr:DUF4479 and tRNA-binding domain-containing protein [Periweissella cryptocerci]QBO35464.1 DUF4479 domain-containing protein [Periweissella cryptocerci]